MNWLHFHRLLSWTGSHFCFNKNINFFLRTNQILSPWRTKCFRQWKQTQGSTMGRGQQGPPCVWGGTSCCCGNCGETGVVPTAQGPCRDRAVWEGLDGVRRPFGTTGEWSIRVRTVLPQLPKGELCWKDQLEGSNDLQSAPGDLTVGEQGGKCPKHSFPPSISCQGCMWAKFILEVRRQESPSKQSRQPRAGSIVLAILEASPSQPPQPLLVNNLLAVVGGEEIDSLVFLFWFFFLFIF